MTEVENHLKIRLRAAPHPLALLQAAAAAHGDRPAIVFAQSPDDSAPQVLSYRELAETAERVASGLRSLGVGPEDGVALVTPATPNGAAALIGALSAGVAFPMNLLLTQEAMATQLALARTRVALVWNGLEAADRLRAAAGDIPVLDISDAPSSWISRTDLGRAGFAGEPSRAAALFHTGGTTGDPKLAELSASGMAAAAVMSEAGVGFGAGDRMCVAMPLFHVGGAIGCLMGAIAAGATVIFPGLLGGRDPALRSGVWRLLARTEATILIMVPTSLAGVVDTPVDAVLARLRAICTGAAPMPAELARQLEEKMRVPVCQVYGMTELSGICSAQPCDGVFRTLDVGYPTPMIELRVGGGAALPGARGECQFRGPNTFLGYRTAAGRSGEPQDGWVSTGDLGAIEPDGRLKLLGRSKDVIIRGGHNIDPLMIEDIALQHPAVRVAAAAPMPDFYAGELPVLFVVLKSDAAAQETLASEIAAFVASRIADPPARPKRIFIVDEIPMTSVGKVARFRLRQTTAMQALSSLAMDPTAVELTCTDSGAKVIDVSWRRTPQPEEVTALRRGASSLGLELRGEGGLELAGAPAPAA